VAADRPKLGGEPNATNMEHDVSTPYHAWRQCRSWTRTHTHWFKLFIAIHFECSYIAQQEYLHYISERELLAVYYALFTIRQCSPEKVQLRENYADSQHAYSLSGNCSHSDVFLMPFLLSFLAAGLGVSIVPSYRSAHSRCQHQRQQRHAAVQAVLHLHVSVHLFIDVATTAHNSLV